MPDENTLSNLPQGAEPSTPPAPAGEAAVPSTPEATGAPGGELDARPDPEALRKEIEDLQERRKKAEEDAIYWRKQKTEARAEYFKGGREGERPAPSPEDPQLGAEPQPTDFEDYNKYVAALTDYRVKKARVEWDRDQQRRDQERSQQERLQNLHTKLQDGYQRYPDFEEVAFDRTATHITPMIVDILAECENPADVAYYLAKNRVEGVAISRMTPIRAAREIAKIEAKITGSPPPPPPPPTTKKRTDAPPPINPIGSGAASGVTKDPDKMSQREYEEWRRSQGARPY